MSCGRRRLAAGRGAPARVGRATAAARGSSSPTGPSPPATSARSPARSAPAWLSGAAGSRGRARREPGGRPRLRLQKQLTAENLAL